MRELARRAAGPAASPAAAGGPQPATLAGMIDHTILKPDAVRDDIVKLAREALQYGFAAVCVNACWVPLVAEILRGSAVKTCAVVGFPLGAMVTELKVAEARRAIADGAAEVDMVINVGALKGGEMDFVESDIRAVVQAAREQGAIVKVILETCLLSRDEKVTACLLSKKAGAHFVKTSTGFASGGATVADVRLMRETVGDALQVKASGGIRNYSTAVEMIQAGATRIGTSSGVAIVSGR
ncbi:MAG: deoxyribose-phosphate aldolase [Acidobacteria bacterium]|nr:deoxyribose-phosphate aldolase [Acidobacteriota bacterium]